MLVVFGTRPEAIKMAPVIAALRESQILDARVCVTAQHRQMLDQILDVFAIEPTRDLDLMTANQSLAGFAARGLEGVAEYLGETSPVAVVVQGDTTTAMVASLAAFYHGTPIGHVEAGLRTYNISAPFPEEANRQIIRVLADYHFAPTKLAAQRLLEEGVPPNRVFVTGNTAVDAVLEVLQRARRPEEAERLRAALPFIATDRQMVLITGHRRESFGEAMRQICLAFRELAERYSGVEFVYPVHLNPNVRGPVGEILETSRLRNFHLIEPVEYVQFVGLMDRASLIITDSGGIQEEAPSLGKHVLVTREVTERPEGLDSGLVKLVGTVRRTIVDSAAEILDRKILASGSTDNPYGDGRAGKRIVRYLEKALVARVATLNGEAPIVGPRGSPSLPELVSRRGSA